MTTNTEKALIGALLYTPEVYSMIVDTFKKEDLRSILAQKAFQAIEHAIKNSTKVENSLIASAMSNGVLEHEQEAMIFLVECQFACPSAMNIKQYAKEITEVALRAKIAELAKKTAYDTANPDITTRDIQAQLSKFVSDIAESSTPTHSINVTQAISEYLDEYHDIIDKENEGKTRMFYGVAEVDEITSGITSGEFIVVAARTNVGKSIFALNLHYNIGKQQKKVLYCSIEMSKSQITSRLLSRITGIPQTRFNKYQLKDSENDKVAEAYEELKGYDMHFLTKGELTLDHIRMELIKNQAHQYDCVIVDYVQIMTHGDNKMGTTEKVTQLSHGLKQLAQEFETAIIGVAQLNREAVKDGVPEIHHLQNSGALEQDAEVVILLHRDKEDPAQVDGKALTLLIRKNRKGANYIDIRLPADLARMYISNKSDF